MLRVHRPPAHTTARTIAACGQEGGGCNAAKRGEQEGIGGPVGSRNAGRKERREAVSLCACVRVCVCVPECPRELWQRFRIRDEEVPQLELARHAARRASGWAPQMHCSSPREGGEAAEGVGGGTRLLSQERYAPARSRARVGIIG
jgi:hypothetical protein